MMTSAIHPCLLWKNLLYNILHYNILFLVTIIISHYCDTFYKIHQQYAWSTVRKSGQFW